MHTYLIDTYVSPLVKFQRGQAFFRLLVIKYGQLLESKGKPPMKPRKSAIAYLRTSSAANVGPDRDSDKRQRAAIAAYAKANGFELVAEYYDQAVSGADPVTERKGFMAALEH